MANVDIRASIIRQVSELLGKSQINQTSSGGPAGAAIDSAYDRLLPSILEGDDWRFATVTIELNKLEHTSNVPRFKSVYLLPDNYLRLNYLIPNTTDYDIQERYLYCNSDKLLAEIRFRVDESRFPPSFVDFFIFKLASELAAMPAFSVPAQLVSWLASEADKKYIKALSSNGQSVPSRSIVDAPLIDAGFW